MGAKPYQIAVIFGSCGMATGLFSSFCGMIAAIFTLKHLDKLVNLLSTIQGHNAFHTSFFGQTLPNSLSMEAVLFILISTPLIALTAGLIPAIKASKTEPSTILKSQ